MATIYASMTRFDAFQFIKELLPMVDIWYASQLLSKEQEEKPELISIVGSNDAHRTFP